MSSSKSHVKKSTSTEKKGQSNSFVLYVNGQIDYAELPGAKNLVCEYRFVYGTDWEVLRATNEEAILQSGLSQIAQRSPGCRAIYLWNFPIEITFRSTNPYGWPKIIITVMESAGKNPIIKGYGWAHVPVSPGKYRCLIRLFTPKNTSIVQSILSSITKKYPEFIDPAFVGEGEGREVTRVKSEGAVRVSFDLMIKDMHQFGFEPNKNKSHGNDHTTDDNALLDDYSSMLGEHKTLKKIS